MPSHSPLRENQQEQPGELPRTFSSERLLARLPTLDDAEAMFTNWASDPRVTKYLLWPAHETIDTTRAFLREMLSDRHPAGMMWVLERHSDGELLGSIGVRLDGHRAEIGYCLGQAFWGQGYMPEAVRALVRELFRLAKIHRVWAVCEVSNTPSKRVLEKAGLHYEGILRAWQRLPNLGQPPRDMHAFAVTRQ